MAVIATLAVAGMAVQALPAQAAVLRPCAESGRVLCGRVSVPLDRAGQVPGRISLAVKLVRATGPSRGTVLFLAGGPGQSTTPLAAFLGDPKLSPLGVVLRTHDLLLVDQRGTGGSGVLRCPLIELTNAADPSPEIRACATRLGPRRDYYQTRDSVEDIESVRTALGRRRLSVIGVSYGTKVALSYARHHPASVERLVLDSVVAPGGPDPLLRDTLSALPRVLRGLCQGACRRINPDPVGDVREIVARLRGGPALGFAVGLDGRRHTARLQRPDLLGVIITGDLGPSPIFAELPAALRSARQGDTGPLLRLERVAAGIDPGSDPRAFSVALLVATTCSETPLPWSPSTPIAGRLAEARAAALALGDAAFDPFDTETALQAGSVALCAAWPAPARPPADETGPLPAVPTLVLNGTRDLRTPLEGARAAVSSIPGARVVPVAATGHSPLTTDLTGCASRVLQRFFARLPVGSCSRGRALLAPTPVAPTSLAQVAPAPGLPGRIGRTACAVGMTLGDATVAILGGAVTTGAQTLTLRATGLRAGTLVVRVRLKPTPMAQLSLLGFSYVRDVVVSGLPRSGVLRVSGPAAAPGVVRLAGTRLVGRLGGRAVNVSLAPCLQGGFRPVIFLPAGGSSLAAAAVRPRLR